MNRNVECGSAYFGNGAWGEKNMNAECGRAYFGSGEEFNWNVEC